MKRTPLRRYTPLRARRPGKRSEPGSTAYLNWIRSLPCAVCDGRRGKSQAAHTNVLGRSGMGEKTSAFSCIPLCAADHTLRDDSYHHITPEDRWSDFHAVDVYELVHRLNRCWQMMREQRGSRACAGGCSAIPVSGW